jgi:hypothetical protein
MFDFCHNENNSSYEGVELNSMQNSSVVSDDELSLVRDFIILPFLLTMIDNYSKSPEKTPFEEYKPEHFQRLLDIIHADMVKIRAGLKAAQMKVVELAPFGPTLIYEYFCRGYRAEFRLMRTLAKVEISVKLGRYKGILDNELRNFSKDPMNNKRG